MPLMTMTNDVAIRMVSSNESSAGSRIYGCNHARQRIPMPGRDGVLNGNTEKSVTTQQNAWESPRLLTHREANACDWPL